MNTTTSEIMRRGMECLTKQMGIVEAEQFISVIIREKFDYTKWQREYFDKMQPGEFTANAAAYAKSHPYTGKGQIL